MFHVSPCCTWILTTDEKARDLNNRWLQATIDAELYLEQSIISNKHL